MPAAGRSTRTVVLFVAFLAILMAFGVEAMLPAFDQLDDQFGFDARDLSVSLLVTSLLVGMAIGQLFWGPVSDRYGRRPILLVGFVLYGVGALGSALAPNLELLLIARAVWGFGAAAPGGMRFAIARDLYSGDEMARVVTISQAVFLIGPLLMPIVGEAILVFGSWQAIAYAGLVLAAFGAAWTVRFGETLAPADRSPLSFRQFGRALAIIGRSRQSAGSIISLTFFMAAFFVWLGSAQPIIDEIYGLDRWFIWLFGAAGIVMSVAQVVADRAIARFGTTAVAFRSAASFVGLAVGGLALGVIGGGEMAVGVWLVWVAAVNAFASVMSSVCTALALDPVGEVAGTTSSLLGFAALGPGALLAAIVDSRIDDSVMPMLIGATVFGLFGYAALRWSQPNSSGISAFRRPMKSSISSSAAESIGGAS